MRHLSAKIRITLWFAVMMVIIDALVLTFISVINVNVVTRDPEAVLVEELNRNVDRLGESDALRLDAVDYQQRGVYSILYDADGSVMRGAPPAEFTADEPLTDHSVRLVRCGDHAFYVYDVKLVRSDSSVWLRGVIETRSQAAL